MYEAIVTFVTIDVETGDVITKVCRVEFQSEEDFQLWIDDSRKYNALSAENLTAETVGEQVFKMTH